MKAKPIVPCPLKFLRAGFKSVTDAAGLVHIGRGGLQGCLLSHLATALNLPISTADTLLRRLADAGYIVRFSRTNTTGRGYWWVVTVKGWELLTQSAEVEMFPDALKMPMPGGGK